jgi:hypothetical protein
MPSNEPLTRAQVSEMKFDHQVEKAIRKEKLIELHFENGDKIADTELIIEPAFFVYNIIVNEELFDNMGVLSWEEIVNDIEVGLEPKTKPNSDKKYYALRRDSEWVEHPAFVRKNIKTSKAIFEASTTENVYALINQSDPTPNKEYVQWIIGMYVRVLKDRKPNSGFLTEENKMGGDAYSFFEDLFKLSDALKLFHKMKNSKVLSVDQKDIYTYRSITDFVETVFKADITETTGLSNTDILSAKELEQINLHNAIITHQDPKWIVVHTVNKDANIVFGENTTWCTAGDRHTSMFDNYNRQGKLLVIIKNEIGASAHLKTNPNNRLQFHFETGQFMNALDRSIDISKFLSDNFELKEGLREHIVGVMLKKHKKLEDMITFLNKFGMVKELIPILKESKVKVLDLSSAINKNADFEFKDIGEVNSLEELTIRDCGLTTIPESLRNLKNLRILRLSDNKITDVPEWISDFKKLEILNLQNNLLTHSFDVSGLSNLIELQIGRNKKLTVLPTGIEHLSKLLSLDFAFCGVKEIPVEVTKCKMLHILNAARNYSLTKITDEIVLMPNLRFLSLDDTGISKSRLIEIEQIKRDKDLLVASELSEQSQ